jgi:biotin carboxyl carrier protein
MGILFGLINGKEFRIETGLDGSVSINGKEAVTDMRAVGENRYSLLVNGRSVSISVSGPDGNQSYLVNGKRVSVVIESARSRLLKTLEKTSGDHQRPLEIHAPMPALVSSVPVQVGEAVTAGQALIVLEAMKMENEVRAHGDGIITGVFVKKGDSVEKGAILLRLDARQISE